MEIGALLITLALALLAALYISRPFADERAHHLLKHQNALAEGEQRVSALLAERDRVLAALQELDFDHQLGKISDEDYPAQRAALLQTGAGLLKALDEAGQAAPRKSAGQPVLTDPYLRRLNLPTDDLEARIAAHRARRTGKSAGFCPQCGKPVQKSDRFCSRCGTTLDPAEH